MKAKLTTNHDWVRLNASESKLKNLSLTVSRRGEKCSGRGITEAQARAALRAFGGLIKRDGTIGEKMEALRAHAERSADLDAFIAGVEQA